MENQYAETISKFILIELIFNYQTAVKNIIKKRFSTSFQKEYICSYISWQVLPYAVFLVTVIPYGKV